MTERVAIVTGGTRGIGAAISELLAADGTHVAAVYAGRHDAARELAGGSPRPAARSAFTPATSAIRSSAGRWSPGSWPTGDGWTTWSTTPACWSRTASPG